MSKLHSYVRLKIYRKRLCNFGDNQPILGNDNIIWIAKAAVSSQLSALSKSLRLFRFALTLEPFEPDDQVKIAAGQPTPSSIVEVLELIAES